ncbi:MAG TPA: DUF3592 domain-containing protein [Bordetella sp.]|uniref:DUF3592 domain-containing protein n=1 Tax=Bordetella sp. BOR01 TaxID=2854779 RepID=UPI001C491730|nr:DUF3592 domain-containing protein [Bordetella sp. BOR01]MBV7484416.1 DUF3592 domain-containing protein [Bordetella sp. BOR01]HYG45489.1 DUF3592 domain-containing protein [Bordetella sp.]
MGNAVWWVIGTVATVAFVAFVAMVVRETARPYEDERSLAARLAHTGQPVLAEVLALDRQPGGKPYAAPMKLGVRYADANGREQRADLRVYIDRELLAAFMPGKTIHVRYDANHPSRLAVDRQLSPTEIPATWRNK